MALELPTKYQRLCRVARLLAKAGVEVQFWQGNELAFDPDIQPGLILKLRAYGDRVWTGDDPLRAIRPDVRVQLDFEGTIEEGVKLGLWLIWGILYRAQMVQDPPPLRWQSVELAPVPKRMTKRRRRK